MKKTIHYDNHGNKSIQYWFTRADTNIVDKGGYRDLIIKPSIQKWLDENMIDKPKIGQGLIFIMLTLYNERDCALFELFYG